MNRRYLLLPPSVFFDNGITSLIHNDQSSRPLVLEEGLLESVVA